MFDCSFWEVTSKSHTTLNFLHTKKLLPLGSTLIKVFFTPSKKVYSLEKHTKKPSVWKFCIECAEAMGRDICSIFPLFLL